MICARFVLLLILAVSWVVMGAPNDNERLINDVEESWSADHPLRQAWLSNSAIPFQPRIRKAPAPQFLDDEGSVDNALINYLFAKQIANRLRSQDSADLQRKRSYWKQCAFNAVSCFGK